MKNLLKVIVCLIAVTMFPSCTSQPGTNNKAGTLVITLEGNTTTGYSWTYKMNSDEIVEEVSSEYIKPDAAIGAGGTFVFTFAALHQGETEIAFYYTRPWETAPDAKPDVVYFITVNPDLSISFVKTPVRRAAL
ncbi:MAG: protease inhibitor I42 family protein [Spirochaetaceae bacterium]|jgi:predicted secreted protein|nr:protease inhibitor I42 family protein [Spirochaetaceae bacterium]